MHTYTQSEAVRRMNELGRRRSPFIFIVDYTKEASLVEEVSAIRADEILYDWNGFTNSTHIFSDSSGRFLHWNAWPETFDSYRHSFDIVRQHILKGNSFLVNLTCRTPIETNFSLKEIFFYSQAMYKLWVKDCFTVFSPEIFVRIQEGKIFSYPMKGTIDASLPDAAQRLMDDPKEKAEHATIVDLIRNDLSMVASHIEVSKYRYIDELQTHRGRILQTSSEIQGILPADYHTHIGTLLFALLPAGSITGAPKRKTVQIIEEAEHYKRGFYTGVMGHFDGRNLDSAVMIRFIEQDDGRLWFKSGGGITCRSNAESEYNEMKQKIYVPIY